MGERLVIVAFTMATLLFPLLGVADPEDPRPCVAGTAEPVREDSLPLLSVGFDGAVDLTAVSQRYNLSYPHRQGELLLFPVSRDVVVDPNSTLPPLLKRVSAKRVSEDLNVPMLRVQLPKSAVLQDAADELMQHGAGLIRSVEANGCIFLKQSSKQIDPEFDSQWGHHRIGVEEAWKTTTGVSSVVVAIVDSGIDHLHPDLACNFWVNGCETIDQADNPCSGQVGDGLADDLNGWNFVNKNNQLYDSVPHGTAVAGVVGACRNTIDIVGVNWSVSLMDLRVSSTLDDGTVEYVISAFAYAVRNGADVINLSSLTPNSKELFNLIKAAQDIIVTVPAGDAVADGNRLDDKYAAYPCSWTPNLPNLICATSSMKDTDEKGASANFGDVVQLAAPGVNIVSTMSGDTGEKSGTSFAAPYVAGVVALLKAHYPLATTEQIVKCAITGDDVTALSGMTKPGRTAGTGVRLSATQALECMGGS